MGFVAVQLITFLADGLGVNYKIYGKEMGSENAASACVLLEVSI